MAQSSSWQSCECPPWSLPHSPHGPQSSWCRPRFHVKTKKPMCRQDPGRQSSSSRPIVAIVAGCTLDLDPLDPSCVPVPSAVPSATTWGDAAHGADGSRVVRVTAATPADNRCSFSIGGGRHCAGSEGEVNVMHSAAGRHDLQPAAIFGLGHVPPKDPQCIAHHFSIGCRLRISPDLIESLLGFW